MVDGDSHVGGSPSVQSARRRRRTPGDSERVAIIFFEEHMALFDILTEQ